jgi:hypothetical protein
MITDIIEIQQLLHRYCHVLDRGTIEEIIDVFHRDAVLLPRYQGNESFSGRDTIRAWYQNYKKTVKDSVRNLRHKVTCPWIQVSGNEATSVCYLDADYVNKSTAEVVVAAGRYEDKLVKDEGRWWIKEREILVDGFYPLGPQTNA